MSNLQVIVKAYYNDLVETQPEIRRFTLDISPNNNAHRALETSIAQLNTDYQPGQFTLQYIDEDNDRITFSSDTELRSALNNIPIGGTLKIYVKPITKKSEAKPTENTNVHAGITCDGCQGPVIGNRYKCTECPDYDLCQVCSDKNLHPDHNMIKFTRPFSRMFDGARRFARGPFGGGRCGRGGPRFWHHFMNQRQQQCGGEAGFQFPNDMANFLGQFKGKELADFVEAHLPEYFRTEKIKEMLNKFRTGEQADKPVDHNTLLENVGQFLQEVLSPFGIDCDYFVDKQQTENRNEKKNNMEKAEETTASSNTTTEPKPSAPPSMEAPSASASSAAPPVMISNLFGQFQSMMHQAMASQTPAPTVDDQQAQEKKKIDECIERMTAMGFVDSNGVLTELIKSKKGDLNQVLDALNPRNYQN